MHPSRSLVPTQRRSRVLTLEGKKKPPNSPSLSLNRLHQERTNLLPVLLECPLDSLDVVVLNLLLGPRAYRSDSLEEGSETDSRLRIGRHGDDTEGSTVEVSVRRASAKDGEKGVRRGGGRVEARERAGRGG